MGFRILLLLFLVLHTCQSKSLETERIEKAVAKIAEEEMKDEEETEGPSARVSFAGFKILEVTPNTESDVDLLRLMEDAPDTGGIDFWVSPTAPSVPVTIAVRPDLVPLVESVMEQREMGLAVVADDLQHLIDVEESSVLLRAEEEDDGLNYRDPSKSYYDDGNYNRLAQIETHLGELVTQYSGFATR